MIRLLLLTLVALASSFPLMAQESYSYGNSAPLAEEVINLREQIELVIKNSHLSLVEADAKLLAALQRIKALEEENQQLNKQIARNQENESSTRGRLARKLERTESARNELVVENMLLKKELKNAQLSQSQALQEQAQQQSRISKKSDALGKQQSSAYQTLEHQFQLAGREILRLKSELSDTQKQLLDLDARHQSMLSEYQLKNKNLLLQVNGLTAQLQSQQIQSQQLASGQLFGKQLIDSLRYELSAKERMMEVLNRADRVNKDRIVRLESGERALEAERKEMTVRRQLLMSREQELAREREALVLREEKYRNLEVKEKQLKLLEQRLKASGSPAYENGTARGQ